LAYFSVPGGGAQTASAAASELRPLRVTTKRNQSLAFVSTAKFFPASDKDSGAAYMQFIN
jgi:hypothetical protein